MKRKVNGGTIYKLCLRLIIHSWIDNSAEMQRMCQLKYQVTECWSKIPAMNNN